jgi:microcystin-dependent protein
MDNYIGEIKAFPYNYVPEYWFPCDGRSLPVQQYTPLYAVIGNYYGGDQNNFNLPNLQGVVMQGSIGSGIEHIAVGQKGGEESVTLKIPQIPAHIHNIQAEIFSHSGAISQLTNQPGPTVFLTNASYTTGTPPVVKGILTYANTTSPETTLNPATLGVMGTGGAHENRMPFLPLNFGICWNGVFPSHQ